MSGTGSDIIGWDNLDLNTSEISNQHVPGFKAAINILDIPKTTTVGTPLIFTGTVIPNDVANHAPIQWEVHDPGTTNAIISGNTLIATATGRARIIATIKYDDAADRDYVTGFYVTVTN